MIFATLSALLIMTMEMFSCFFDEMLPAYCVYWRCRHTRRCRRHSAAALMSAQAALRTSDVARRRLPRVAAAASENQARDHDARYCAAG